jgi:antitoxin ParD1/3/4
MPTRNVVITDHQAELIDRLVASGRYQNASEVLRAGLRMLERDDEDHEAKLAALRAAVQVGIDDVEAGRYRHFDSMDDAVDHLQAVAQAAIHRAGS